MTEQKWYRPREIAQRRLIHQPRGNSEAGLYNYILEQIKMNKLKAKSYNVSGPSSYWLVSRDEIKRFNKSID